MAGDDNWFHPERMAEQARRGEGVFGTYDAFERAGDESRIRAHAIIDDDYARTYAGNLRALLGRLGVGLRGNILDVGCGPGAVTEALRAAAAPGSRIFGIDLSDSAIRFALRSYPQCAFAVGSADALEGFADGSFALVHAREFYPFTRSADPRFHLRFLSAFLPKLTAGGGVAAVQVVNKAGLADRLAELSGLCAEGGYAGVERHPMIPNRVFRRLGAAAYLPGVYPAGSFALGVLERARPGLVTFVYLFRAR